MMKFGAMILVYRQADYLELCINEIREYFDSIICMYTDKPFAKYNPECISKYGGDDGSIEILNSQAKEYSNLQIEKGYWESEELMREHAKNILIKKGIEYIFIIDADEFYPENMIKNIQNWIVKDNRVNTRYTCRFRNLYKKPNYEIIGAKLYQTICFHAQNESKFINGRTLNIPKIVLPNKYYFWHTGYVLGDDRMLEKIETFSHSDEIEECWYEEKWLKWCPETKNLGRKKTDNWERTKKISLTELPASLLRYFRSY